MKITITGSLGNISKPLAVNLIKAGHEVTVISSKEDRKEDIEKLGATAAIGSVLDEIFLKQAFNGADAVYIMTPPNLQTTDYLTYSSGIVEQYVKAIRATAVKRVVNLSSVGAHLESGTGPIEGHHKSEAILEKLGAASLTHVRAGFFYTNFYGNIDMIRNMGIIGSNYAGNSRIVFVSPSDIAAAVAEELQKTGDTKRVQYISSDERSAQESATILGTAIGLPALPWVQFPDDQLKGALAGAGFSEEMAGRFVAMGQSVQNGKLWGDYDTHHTIPTGKIKLEEFAKEFALVYKKA